MKFFDGSWDPAGTDKPAADLEPADPPEPTGELIFDGAEDEEKAVAPLTESQRRARDQLATFLNCQLMAIGGFWIGAVPTALISFGSAVGGWSGGIVFTVLLATSGQLFLSNHPTFPYNAYLKRFGWEIVRRRDGRKTYLIVVRPNAEEQAEIDENGRNYRELDRVYHAQRAEERREKRRGRALQRRHTRLS